MATPHSEFMIRDNRLSVCNDYFSSFNAATYDVADIAVPLDSCKHQ